MSKNNDVDRWIEGQPDRSQKIALSVIVPAYNEYRRLPVTLMEMVDFLDAAVESYEIIVVDDGSRDETSTLVTKFEKIRGQIRLIRLPKNYGKGHAVKLGMLNARGSRVMFADADGATPFSEVARLQKALDSGADVAIGSRAKRSDETRVTTRFYRKYLGRIFNSVVNLFVVPGVADTQCGFKMFTSSAAQFLFERQRSDGFSFDVEILYLAQRASLKIAEVPINWNNVPGSKVNLFTDSLRMLRDLFLFRLWHRTVTAESLARPPRPSQGAPRV